MLVQAYLLGFHLLRSETIKLVLMSRIGCGRARPRADSIAKYLSFAEHIRHRATSNYVSKVRQNCLDATVGSPFRFPTAASASNVLRQTRYLAQRTIHQPHMRRWWSSSGYGWCCRVERPTLRLTLGQSELLCLPSWWTERLALYIAWLNSFRFTNFRAGHA